MFEIITQAVGELTNGWRRQAAVRELNELNDHLLDDIGLRREQLPTYIMGAGQSPEAAPTHQHRSAPQLRLVGCG